MIIGEGKPHIKRLSGSLGGYQEYQASNLWYFLFMCSLLCRSNLSFFLSISVTTASGLVNYFFNFHIQPWFYIEFMFHTSLYCHFKSLWKMTEKCITRTKCKIDEIAFSRQRALYSNKYCRDRHVKSALFLSHHLLNSSCNL